VRAIARLEQLKLLRFLHRRLSYTKSVQRTVTAVHSELAWWLRRFQDSVIGRPIVYLMALSSESSPAVVAAMIRRLALSREQAKKVSSGGRSVDRALKRLTDPGTVRPSQAYRLLEDFSDEALVLLLAKQRSTQSSVGFSLLKRRIVAYMKNKAVKTTLTGRDLQIMGIAPGPQYKTILGKLLDARIDGMVTTEEEERAFVRKWLGNQNVGDDCL
jgi:tRNA nucleotidyltransferase (CCA-adding enzyme)